MILHQSDLQSWARCPEEWRLESVGAEGHQLSATAYGSVIHHAMHVFERTGNLDLAVSTFEHYWHPLRIEAICEPVTEWMRGHSYEGLLRKGVDTLRKYAHLIAFDDHELLALEFEFIVPIHGTVDRETGEPHLLAGTTDRLSVRHHKRIENLCIDDFKSGKRKVYLRHNVQGTAYAYASMQPEFWLGNPAFHTDGFGEERGGRLIDRFADTARRFWWIDLKDCRRVDGGYRGPRDYARFVKAAQAVADSRQAGIFPLTLDGTACEYCQFRRICAGIGVDDKDGDPT